MRINTLFLIFLTIICFESFIFSIKLEEALSLKVLYSRLKQKMEMVDKGIILNSTKKNGGLNLLMESKSATTTPPKSPPNLRSSAYILNNILKSPLGSRLQV